MRSRMDAATEAFRQALNLLAVAAPAWLLGQTRPHWADRYSGHGDWGHAAKVSNDIRNRPPGDMRKGPPVEPSVTAACNPW